MKKAILGAVIVAALAMGGCTDAERASMGSYGSQAQVTCYSGGKPVFEDVSTGKVMSGQGEEGIVFKSKTTGNYVRAFADCIVIEKG